MAIRWRWPPENSRGQPPAGVRGQADLVEQVADPLRRPPRGTARRRCSGSVRICSTVSDGFSEVYGSWKTTWISLLRARRSLRAEAGDVLPLVADRRRR